MRPALALAGVALTLALSGPTLAQGSASPAGQWRTDDGQAIVTVAACGQGRMCGRISRILAAQPAGGARDRNNPDASLRSRPLLGVEVLSGLTRSGNAWSGRAYSPQEGRTVDATVTPDGNRLSIRGCVAIFCRTVVWTRAG